MNWKQNFKEVLPNQTWVHTLCAMKPTYWYWVMGKESTAFIAGHWARSPRGQGSESPNFLMILRESVLKIGEGTCGVHNQHVDFLLIGQWWENQESTSTAGSSLLGIYVLVDIIQLTFSNNECFSIWKTAQRIWLNILSPALEEQLNVLEFA